MSFYHNSLPKSGLLTLDCTHANPGFSSITLCFVFYLIRILYIRTLLRAEAALKQSKQKDYYKILKVLTNISNMSTNICKYYLLYMC
jgi:hypothetical protein